MNLAGIRARFWRQVLVQGGVGAGEQGFRRITGFKAGASELEADGDGRLLHDNSELGHHHHIDDAAQNLFIESLEHNMQMFTEQQKRFQQSVEGMIDNPVTRMVQDATERNLKFWQDMQKGFFDLATSGIRTTEANEEDGDASPKKKHK